MMARFLDEIVGKMEDRKINEKEMLEIDIIYYSYATNADVEC